MRERRTIFRGAKRLCFLMSCQLQIGLITYHFFVMETHTGLEKVSHTWVAREALTGLFLYLRPYHNPWIKKAKKLLGCAQDFRLENWILVE